MKQTTALRPPPLTLLGMYHGRETQTLYLAIVTVTGGYAGHGRASGVHPHGVERAVAEERSRHDSR